MNASPRPTPVVLTALVAICAAPAFAAPTSNSPYNTDVQHSHVEDATSRGIGEVNMIACIMSAMRPDALVNEPSYVALIDKNKCDSDKRSSTTNAGASDGAQAAASYMTATVTSLRESNTAPMITRAWLDLDEGGAHVQISVHISATEAPSTSNPYGAFRLDYCGQLDQSPECVMRGYLEAANGGIDFYQVDNGNYTQTTAMNLAVAGAGANGRLETSSAEGDAAFAFAYDQTLFHRDIDGDNQCFSRDARDPDTGLSVWRYGLYDAQTGARIERNSGFPIEFVQDGTTYNGFLGYYGLSLPPAAANLLSNGDTVTKVDYGNGDSATRTDYEVVKGSGKLIRYSKRTSTLAQLDQIRFNTFVGGEANTFFAGATANTQYELYWNETSADFVVTGQMDCDNTGCQTHALSGGEQHVPASFWAARGGVQGWSQSLGGEVFIDLQGVGGTLDATLVPVSYRTQDLVYPADLPATLYCVQNCPTSASLEAYFASSSNDPSASPYASPSFNNWNPTPLNAVVQYGTNAGTVALMGGDGSTADVTFTNAAAYQQHPQYSFGVTSGRLFENLDDAACDLAGGGTGYCDWKVNSAEVYYQWQTGPNSWNQFAAVKDSGGDVVAFDAPLQLNYQVPDAARYGEYRNTSIVLQYGGFGDLWGIPGTCVSRLTNEPAACEGPDARYVPSFVIPYDQTLGTVTSTGSDATAYLVKWLDREIRFARKAPSQCDSLTLPLTVQLPTAQVMKNPTDAASDIYIGVKPVVTDAPRVIHGEVKY